MEPNNHQMMLLFLVFTLIIFNLQAGCSHQFSISPAPNSPPNLQSVSLPQTQPTPEHMLAPTPPPSQLAPLFANAAQKTSSIIRPAKDNMRMLTESQRGNLLYQSINHRHYHHHRHHHPFRPLLARNLCIKKICDSTDYPSLCLSLIAPFFNRKRDSFSVLEISIRASSQQVKLAIGAASKLARTMPSATASNLHHCKIIRLTLWIAFRLQSMKSQLVILAPLIACLVLQ